MPCILYNNALVWSNRTSLVAMYCLPGYVLLILSVALLEMLDLTKNYSKSLEEEMNMTPEQLAIKNVGKQDPKRHLEERVSVLMTSNIVQCLGAMLHTVAFHWCSRVLNFTKCVTGICQPKYRPYVGLLIFESDLSNFLYVNFHHRLNFLCMGICIIA